MLSHQNLGTFKPLKFHFIVKCKALTSLQQYIQRSCFNFLDFHAVNLKQCKSLIFLQHILIQYHMLSWPPHLLRFNLIIKFLYRCLSYCCLLLFNYFSLVNALQRLKVSEACKHSCNLYPAGAGRGNLSALFAAGCN